MKTLLMLSGLLALCVTPAIANPFYYDEMLDGPLSNDRLDPTMLSADIGENVLRGDINSQFTGDFFTFNVPANATAPSLVVNTLTNPADFSLTVSSEPIDWQDQSGFVYFGETDDTLIGLNLLSELGIGPLPAGPYWFCFGPDDGASHAYEMTVSIVPEPGTILFLAVLFFVFMRHLRRYP